MFGGESRFTVSSMKTKGINPWHTVTMNHVF